MTELHDVGAWLAERLPALLAEHDVPAAAVAVCAGADVVDHAAGTLSTATGVEATTDAVFQIGSVTKVWTATLVMQLADDGLLELDAPVRRYLPDVRLADEGAAAVMTVRQLLSHTAGFEGDVFTDTGRGDDALRLYVEQLASVDQLFAPGAMFSYNNAGYCLLGRLVEVLREATFDDCVRSRLLDPLGLRHAASTADEAILFRAAVGHVRSEAGAAQEPAPVWSMARSNAPAGSMLAMRARDLLAFAQAHLAGGAGPDGARVLSAASAAAMQERQVELPRLGVMGDAWGLGWEVYDTPSGPLVGHDGNTIGQASFLRLVPGRGVAVALLTNGGDPFGLYRDVVGHVLASLAGVELPPLPAPPPDPSPVSAALAARAVGTYSNQVADVVVTQDEQGAVWRELRPRGVMADLGEQAERAELVAHADDALIPRQAQQGIHVPHVFLGDDGSGRAAHLHIGRAVRRSA